MKAIRTLLKGIEKCHYWTGKTPGPHGIIEKSDLKKIRLKTLTVRIFDFPMIWAHRCIHKSIER